MGNKVMNNLPWTVVGAEVLELRKVADDMEMPTCEELEERCRCWMEASVIVGMHPDQVLLLVRTGQQSTSQFIMLSLQLSLPLVRLGQIVILHFGFCVGVPESVMACC